MKFLLGEYKGRNKMHYTEEEINKAIKRCCLSKSEIEIIMGRLGLNGRKPLSLQETQEKYNISIEFLKEIEKKVISELRQQE